MKANCRCQSIVPVLIVFECLLFSCTATYAQSGLSSIRGEVNDPQGKAVVGATVTLKSPDRNLTRTQNTNEKGSYLFSSLPPGAYRVEVEAPGFKKLIVDEVRALVDQPTELNLTLEIGEITLSITVTAEGGRKPH